MSVDVESEAMLENKFIKQLQSMGYEYIKLKDENGLNNNFKSQLEKLNKKELNGKPLTDEEFDRILIYLDSGSIFDKADKLRDEYTIKRDDGTSTSIKFLNQKDWCKNIFQVSNQITMRSKYETRYDVTILINGLPLVQVELKRRSKDISEAFNQVKRYMKTSYKNLFGYIQIFVVSNGLETKYFANSRHSEAKFEFTFYWKDKDNYNIHSLKDFTDDFLEQCNIAKMISKYMVLNKSSKQLMVLRAYQKYAVDAVINQALEVKKNGYIWHTTGSGKTLTSFKVSQLLSEEPSIYKVIFVVDRSDLNEQTNKEFNKFNPTAVMASEHTGALVENLLSGEKRLIISTIQKLNKAVTKRKKKLEKIKDKNIIFIYDECHRSNFGSMQQNISEFFENSLAYGFTGTPIFEENAPGYKTTKSIFGDRLHTYMIKDAIADHNVLGFSIDYYSTMKLKDGVTDEQVSSINMNEVYAHKDRLNEIADNILNTYNAKTRNGEFNAIFAVSQKTQDNETGFLHDYYKIFKEKIKERNLDFKIATIFSYKPNENFDDREKHSQELLDDYIDDYNKMFGTNFSIETKSEYHRDVCKRMKSREIDLLLVINMFLTGFDSKLLNTLYVDKNLEYHGLLQAFSRTNRIYNAHKSHGNIVCYDRPVQNSVDRAISLFSNNAPREDILLPTYKALVKRFNDDLKKLHKLVESAKEVYNIQSETKKKDFVVGFKKLAKTKNQLDTFSEFTFDDLDIDQQEYEDFIGAYQNIKREVDSRPKNGSISILDDIDFELELLENNTINVDYILGLLETMNFDDNYQRDIDNVIRTMENSVHLRSKIKLIEKFINMELKHIKDNDLNIKEEYDNFVQSERRQAICDLIDDENLNEDITRKILSEYEFSEKWDDTLIKESFNDKKLKYKARKNKVENVKNKISEILEIFDSE